MNISLNKENIKEKLAITKIVNNIKYGNENSKVCYDYIYITSFN